MRFSRRWRFCPERRAAVRQPELEQAVRTYLEAEPIWRWSRRRHWTPQQGPPPACSYMAALTARDDRERLILGTLRLLSGALDLSHRRGG